MNSTFSAYQKRFLTLSSLGGALEFYDFVIFVFFAKIISASFFPSDDALASLMNTFAVFAIGYLVRPLGGVIFSHFGDKRGRKVTFVISVFLMAVPTFLMGLLPTYQSIGITATILLILLRVLQGLSIGGEIPGALVFISESVSSARRGLANGILFFGYLMGLLLGSLISTLLVHVLSESSLATWGWRIPFIFGGALGVISFYLRRSMHETPAFRELVKQQNICVVPALDVIKRMPTKILTGVGVALSCAVSVVMFYLFMPTYLNTVLHYAMPDVLLLNAITIIVFSSCCVVGGLWSDKIGHRPIMIVSHLFLAVFAYPLFIVLHFNSFVWVSIVLLLFSVVIGLVTGCFGVVLAEMFPTNIRYSGVAIAYNIGFAIFGGLTPFIVTTLIKMLKIDAAPSFYLIICAVLSVIACWSLKEIKHVACRAD